MFPTLLSTPLVPTELVIQIALAAVIFVIAIISRIRLNTVQQALPVDENITMTYGTLMVTNPRLRDGYQACVDYFSTNPGGIPSPLRWGYLLLIKLCSWGTFTVRILTGISTLSGILSVVLIGLIGWHVGGAWVGIVAASLALSSPLQLHLGRRALNDELSCMSTLFSLFLVLKVLDGNMWPGCVIVPLAVLQQLALKEGSIFGLPALLVVWLFRYHDLVGILLGINLFGMGVFLYFLGLGWFNRWQAGGVYKMVFGLSNQSAYPYAIDHGRGPWHRYLIEFVMVSPLIVGGACVGLVEAIGVGSSIGHKTIALYALSYMTAWSLWKWRNLRWVITVDLVFRVLVAFFLVGVGSQSPWLYGLIPLVWFTEVRIFRKIFVKANVLDPLPYNFVRALEMGP